MNTFYDISHAILSKIKTRVQVEIAINIDMKSNVDGTLLKNTNADFT